VALAVLDAVLSTRGAGGVSFAISLLAAVALLARHRWPHVAFALTVPALTTAYVLVAPLAALYAVAAKSRSRRGVEVCAAVGFLSYYLPWPFTDFEPDRVVGNLLGLIYASVFIGAPVALGLLTRTRQDLDQRLAELTASSQREQQLVAETVRTQERTHLAREMHDVVSHKVSLIAVQAGAMERTTADDVAREAARTIRELSVQTLNELRSHVGVLRGSGGRARELVPQPSLADIPRLLADSGANATTEFHGVSERRWPDHVERAAYRTVQEALTNISKHAPGAQVVVRVLGDEACLRVVVRNGPPAFEQAANLSGGGHGLIGLRERAELLGGTFRAEPTSDHGFLVEAVYPHPSPAQDPRNTVGASPASGGP
jgi:signal transduction histidine kinase